MQRRGARSRMNWTTVRKLKAQLARFRDRAESCDACTTAGT